MSQEEKQITQADLTKEDLEFRKRVKAGMILFIVMGLVGVFTALLPAVAPSLEGPLFNPPAAQELRELQQRLNFFGGMGSALAGCSLVFVIKNYSIMTDPAKLRKARIENKDERTMDITQKARGVAGYALLLALYLGGIIGGIYYPVLHMAMAILVMVYMVSYLAAWWFYNKRM